MQSFRIPRRRLRPAVMRVRSIRPRSTRRTDTQDLSSLILYGQA
jgi:hypothetical protein